MRPIWSAAGAAASALVMSVLSIPAGNAADPVHVPVWDKGPEGERYVAMGDSYVAGPGIQATRTSSGACARSDHNFPSLVAAALDVQSFTDASCAGATTQHFWIAQGTNPPQLDAVGADTTLVTFGTMGGNDVGLIGLATSCLIGDCLGAPGDANHLKVEAAKANLTAGVQAVKAKAPDAVVAVVGYGTYLPAGGCPATVPVDPAEADYVQSVIDHLSDVMEQVATEEGVAFVDMRDIPGAADHTACAAPADQWVRALATHGDGSPLHPSTAGMAAMAGQVRSVVDGIWDASPVHPIPFPPRVVPEPEPEPEPDPEPQPVKPSTPAPAAPAAPAASHATLLAQAEAVLDAVVTRSTCYTPKAHRVVRFKVRRTQGMVERVVYRIGSERIGTDQIGPPFVLQRRASKLAGLEGPVKARVTVRNGEVTVNRMFRIRRAQCIT